MTETSRLDQAVEDAVALFDQAGLPAWAVLPELLRAAEYAPKAELDLVLTMLCTRLCLLEKIPFSSERAHIVGRLQFITELAVEAAGREPCVAEYPQ
jgi:hypothetical protein